MEEKLSWHVAFPANLISPMSIYSSDSSVKSNYSENVPRVDDLLLVAELAY